MDRTKRLAEFQFDSRKLVPAKVNTTTELLF